VTSSTGEHLLLRAYDAYHSARGLSEDAALTRVGRGTPTGELMRRYWQPVAFTHDVKDLPLKVRILGEDLVLFRTGAGEYGLVEQRCSHRGASLEYGVISERGIRCAYHGFHYAPDGSILETGAGAPLANGGTICHGAYPVHVFHELIFTYMGPPELRPPFPMLDLYDQPHVTVEPGPGRTCELDCNWLQVHENGMDPVHGAFLHVLTTGAQRGFGDAVGIIPMTQFVENDYGMSYIITRRLNDDDLVWVRVSDRFLPNVGLTTSNLPKMKENVSQRPFAIHWVVPVDDYTTKRLYLMFNDERNPLRPEQYERGFAQVNDRPYPERQRHPGDYEAMSSQGPIAIHAYENLTPTDYGVIALRYLLRNALRALEEGRDPMGFVRDPNHVIRTRAQTTIVRVPRAETPAADEEMLKRVSREVADSDLLRTLPPV
jgi:phenylpropionate dioxygenase-like ring-hydroxylating dioxygenase large terminal subunit